MLGPNTFVCDPNDNSPHNCVPDGSIWQQYLILLGVPAAAAPVIAKATTSYQVSNGVIQTGQSSQASVSDIATDYTGQADLVDVQYLVFNIIAFLYFFFAHFLHAGHLRHGAEPAARPDLGIGGHLHPDQGPAIQQPPVISIPCSRRT